MTASVFPTTTFTPLGVFTQPEPRWFTLAAGQPFAEDLAAGLCEALLPGGPEALSEALILTPTRRAARAVAQGFLNVSNGKPMLLPQIRAVGDLEVGEPPFEPGDLVLDLPPPVSPLERQLILARLILKQDPALGGDTPRALELAEALAGFLESAAIEGVSDADKLESLVEADYAQHWRQSAAFLAIALKLWPETLALMGRMDPTRRRVVLLERLAAQWRDKPPAHPVVAAGSTGTAPATADLLAVVASAPLGAVVLPGLDQGLADSAWDLVGESHPQGAMKRLLDRHGIDRASVRLWPSRRFTAPAERARRRIVQEALRPAEATADWREQIDKLRAESTEGDTLKIGLEGLYFQSVRHEDEAAMTAAILLRESLERGQGSAALITPDPALARRVRARLSRWGIVPDSSAGTPLLGYPTGRLLMAVAELAEDPLNPVLWLAVVKHPLFRMGQDAEALKPLIGTLEREALRGPRCQSLMALLKRLERYSEASALAEAFGLLIQGFAASFRPDQDLVAALTHLVQVLEAVASTGPTPDQTGGLWAGAGGELAASLLADWLSLSQDLPNVTPSGFTAVVARMLSGATVRTGGATHPQISILGTIEARLVQADRIILAGLEEGVWPAAAPVDPFLSRPMRSALGLPPPERRIGLAAHDFAQAACASEVYLIQAQRRGGAPAVASRWVWRLQTLARGAGLNLPERPEVIDWARRIDAPLDLAQREAAASKGLSPAPRPAPCPPVEVRPRAMAVTGIETWIRDPYAIYSRHILRLRPLDPPDAPFAAAQRGSALHKALEDFAAVPGLGEGAEAVFCGVLHNTLTEAGLSVTQMARESVLAVPLSRAVIEFERRHRPDSRILVEQRGEITLTLGDDSAFTLSARADRLELCRDQVAVLDFKTGIVPSAKEVEAHLSPQLTLTGEIVRRGGFADLGPRPVDRLLYVKLSHKGLEERAATVDPATAIDAAATGLMRHLNRYRRAETPFLSRTVPKFKGTRGDYDHLARVYEWHVSGADAEGGDQ